MSGFPLPDDLLAPAYDGRTLRQVLPAVGAAIGTPVTGPEEVLGLELPPASAYVVLLVDGMGHELLVENADRAPFLASLLPGSEPATVGVPTTTATSLTSLGTGLPPGAHGVVGYLSRVPGTDRLLNALRWDQDVDPHEWQPHPTAFERLRAAGAHASVVNKREFAGSGLTECGQRGAHFTGADRAGERVAGVVAAAGTIPSVTYAYDGDLDWTGHRHGVDSPHWRAQLTAVDAVAEQLRDALPDSVRLLVVADHGMVDSPVEDRVDVDEHPALLQGVDLLGGEARLRHLYCRAGAREDVVVAWREQLGERALVLTREEAVAAGWFGEVAVSVGPRLGDVMVAARGTTAVMSSAAFPHETRLVGLHGSLTPREMLVPILLA